MYKQNLFMDKNIGQYTIHDTPDIPTGNRYYFLFIISQILN